MPNDRYIALPDGRYLHLTGGETPQQVSALRDKLRGQQGPGGLKTFGREAALGAFSGLGIAETQNPIKDTLKAMMKPPDFKDPETYLGPAYGVAKGLAGSTAETFEGLGADAQHPFKFGPMDMGKIGHGLGSLTSQILGLRGAEIGAKTPLVESEVVRGAKAIPDIPPKVVQGATLAKYMTNKAEKAATEAAAKKMETFKAKEEAATVEKAREVAAREKKAIQTSRQETAKRSYEDLKEKTAKEIGENLNKAAKAEKMALDSEYEDFAAKVLGKDQAHPNGTLESDISPVAEAVKNAQDNILKGSEESIKQFKSITARIPEHHPKIAGQGVAETTLAPMKIPADQLRGYINELNEKIYDADVSGDVRQALKSVRDSAQKAVTISIEQKFGRSAVKAYEDLNRRYSDYMATWRDTASGSPLSRIWKIMNQPMAAKMGIPVYREIADILTGSKGEKAIPIIARKKDFGANASLVGKLRQADERAASIPKTKEVPKVTPRERIEPPEIETFDRRTAMRNSVEQGLNIAGRIGQLYKLLSIPADIVHGRIDPAISQAEQMLLIEMVRRGLTSPKVLDYLSKEKP